MLGDIVFAVGVLGLGESDPVDWILGYSSSPKIWMHYKEHNKVDIYLLSSIYPLSFSTISRLKESRVVGFAAWNELESLLIIFSGERRRFSSISPNKEFQSN